MCIGASSPACRPLSFGQLIDASTAPGFLERSQNVDYLSESMALSWAPSSVRQH